MNYHTLKMPDMNIVDRYLTKWLQIKMETIIERIAWYSIIIWTIASIIYFILIFTNTINSQPDL